MTGVSGVLDTGTLNFYVAKMFDNVIQQPALQKHIKVILSRSNLRNLANLSENTAYICLQLKLQFEVLQLLCELQITYDPHDVQHSPKVGIFT